MDLLQLQQQLLNHAEPAPSWPPAHWQPPFCGDLPIRISRDGQWFYQNSPIKRPELIKLFSTVLHCQQGQYLLTTPVESVRIQVEDAPFVLIDWQWIDSEQGPQLQVRDNIDRLYLIGSEYPLQLQAEPGTGQLLPYLQLSRGLTAKFSRNCYYQLAAQAQLIEGEHGDFFVLQSGGYQAVLATQPPDGSELNSAMASSPT
jgi:hypothetical protein